MPIGIPGYEGTTETMTTAEQIKTRSHGRGGAGNINSKPTNTVGADDLRTPALKSTTYTTGRGGMLRPYFSPQGIQDSYLLSHLGSGNMATNDSAESARRAQDVEAPAHHSGSPRGTYHWGRGGEGNKMTVGSSNSERKGSSRSSIREEQRERRSGSFENAFEKGKEMLGLKKGERQS